ncbi:DUF4127 family protein [soil metagenome]
MRIGLVPLDNRPACVRTPRMLARVAGAQLVLPPSEAIDGPGGAGSPEALQVWLRDTAASLDGLVVAMEQVAGVSGGGQGAAVAAMGRLGVLRDIRRDHPDVQLLASTVARPRPVAGPHAPALTELAELHDRHSRGEDVAAKISTAEAAIPETVRGEAAARRMAAHMVQLAALDLVVDGTLDLLVVGAGTGTSGADLQRSWMTTWLRQLLLGQRAELLHADVQLGSTLVMRLLNRERPKPIAVGFCSPVPGAEKRPVAEGATVARTVLRQLRVLGAESAASDVDFVLALHPPPPPDRPPATSGEDPERAAATLADELTRLHALNVPVALADIASQDGGSSTLVERLRSRIDLPRLAGYAAGQTAGDALASALTQGCVRVAASTDDARAAAQLWLLRRLLDDWGYQGKVRGRIRRRLTNDTGSPEPTEANLAAVEVDIERDLSGILAQLPRFTGRYRIVPGSTRLPWQRTDECDFELERLDLPPAERR